MTPGKPPSTQLLVDLGNSRIKWVLAQNRAWDVRISPAAIVEEGRLDELWRDFVPQRVIVASVASPGRTTALAHWVRAHWGLEATLVQARRDGFGVRNLYREPARLGADRWAALIAARSLSGRAAIVIDAGTAITVDALAPDGTFVGGVILPGLAAARRCLSAAAAGIDMTQGDESSCLARSTADGVAAGTYFGIVGALDRICREQHAVLGGEANVYVTGGDAARLLPQLVDATHVPDLVLRGLAVIAGDFS